MLQTAFVERAQEGDGGHDVRRFSTGNGQRTTGLCTHRHEDGIEFLFDVIEGNVSTDTGLEAGFDAHFDDAVDFRIQHFTRGTETGNTVAHHAAEFFVLVENGDAVAAQAELIGRSQASRAGTDDGHFLAGFGRSGSEFHAVLDPPVAHEVFDRVDADVVFDHVAVTARLTRGGAHTTHHAREGVGFRDAAEGVFLPGGACGRLLDAAHDVQITTNVFTGRARTLARRRREHVFRTLVGPACLEDTILGGANVALRLAVLVPTPSHAFGFLSLVGRDSHVGSPNAYKTK